MIGRHLVTALALAAAVAVPAVAAEDDRVVIRDTLRPAVVEIDQGTTITWVNRDDERHRMRSKEGPVRFDSKNLERGETFSFTFTVPGQYPYYDHRNRDDASWFGTVVVKASDAAAEGSEPVESAAVTIVDDAFTTARVTVVPGGTVTWRNQGADEHTVSANDLSFDSGSMPAGAAFSRAFEAVGEYPYFCQIHPEMRATVVVAEPTVEGAASVEPGDATPTTSTTVDSSEATVPDPSAATAPPVDAPSIGSALDLLATPPPE